ncbi:alpha/beta fold hydrolase [Sphingomonas jatrophae]|uniref:Pimeloyl-ACP methyl ester carboxylesterase n=1 Tax=Sphingomonas jatrophae TaxID=1166337 RepID=A0A1I6LFS9_9SPHN|nr:alpha/beta hydrolase [Sphingomonas jatrophae]SFS02324.1 Pimeloyl-ACP methyl ester carboxylesterase [Sphingomonas jatrophae]
MIAPFLLAAAAALAAAPTSGPDIGANLERFAYPFPVHRLELAPQGATLGMAYMDVAPTAAPSGKTVVLMHGKNFCGATWESSARALARAGHRVLIPDQIGFCKSPKPVGYQYSVAGLAANTRALLDAAGVKRATLVGHSMGGMIATRLALLWPERVERLVLVNPIGLVDRTAQGVPYADLAQLKREEQRTDFASIKAYQQSNYYHDRWLPAYDRWAAMLAGQYRASGGETVREAQARTSEMIQTQPVAYEWGRLKMPVTMLIGMLDRTAFGRNRAPAAIRDRILPVPSLVDRVAAQIARADVVRFVDLGHAPQVEAPARFESALLETLRK